MKLLERGGYVWISIIRRKSVIANEAWLIICTSRGVAIEEGEVDVGIIGHETVQARCVILTINVHHSGERGAVGH